MAGIDDVEIPSLLFAELGADPTTPATGKWRLYTKAGGIYLIDDAGAVIGPLTAGGSVSDAVYGAGWNGDTTTAPSKNAVYDKIETLGGGSAMRGASVYRSAALTIANNGTTPVAFDAETFDTDALHDNTTNPSRVLLNAVGKWLCTWQVVYDFSATGVRDASLMVNGSIVKTRTIIAYSSGSSYVTGSVIVVNTATTDYVEISPFQNSGSTRNYGVGANNTYLDVAFLGS